MYFFVLERSLDLSKPRWTSPAAQIACKHIGNSIGLWLIAVLILKDLNVDDVGVTLRVLFDRVLSLVANAFIKARRLEAVCC